MFGGNRRVEKGGRRGVGGGGYILCMDTSAPIVEERRG